MTMRSIAVAVLMTMVAATVIAGPSGKYADWAEGPVKFLMTGDEVARWQTLQSEKEAEEFIALFWAKRDPTPSTPANELRMEFDNRVALADQHFETKRTRGAMTDRGRTLILLGSPFLVGGKGGGGRAEGMSETTNRTLAGPRGASAMLTWTYAQDKKPKFIKRKDLEILFVDDAGDGQWQFAATPKANPEAIMQQALQTLIISPNLTAPPVFEVATTVPEQVKAFRNGSLKSAYDQFKSEQKSELGPAHLTWGEFVTPEGEGFVPVSVYVPASAGFEPGQKVTFFGVIENEAGEIVEVHEDETTLSPSKRNAYLDKSLKLAPGKYTATFGVAAADKITMKKAEMTITGLNAKEPGASDMILSNDAFKLPQAQEITDPFAFGGLKVVPKGDGQFSTADELWYFVELRNPGLAETGAPKVMVKMDITGKTDEQKPVNFNFPIQEVEIIPLKGVENHFGVVQALPLADFKPGQYKFKIKVIDSVLKKNYEVEKPFQVGKL